MICTCYNKLIETKAKSGAVCGNCLQRVNIVINDNSFEQYQILNTQDKLYRTTNVI